MIILDLSDKNSSFFKIIEVKSKQDQNFFWFNGIPLVDISRVVVFVDFKDKKFDEKPDFYILNRKDVLEHMILEQEKYANGCKSSSKTFSAERSKFFQNHPEYEFKKVDVGSRIDFTV